MTYLNAVVAGALLLMLIESLLEGRKWFAAFSFLFFILNAMCVLVAIR